MFVSFVISGVFHSVSVKHLQDYVNEYAFRYNHRDDPGRCLALWPIAQRRYGAASTVSILPLGKGKGVKA